MAICEAFITFLERNGDNGAYWRVLTDAGITRERLEGFDRPIKVRARQAGAVGMELAHHLEAGARQPHILHLPLQVEPQHYPDKKDALIGEFRNYLKILRAVHSGADLQASSEAAGGNLPGNAKGYLGYVLTHQFDSQLLPLIENAVEARTEISQACQGHRCVCFPLLLAPMLLLLVQSAGKVLTVLAARWQCSHASRASHLRKGAMPVPVGRLLLPPDLYLLQGSAVPGLGAGERCARCSRARQRGCRHRGIRPDCPFAAEPGTVCW